MRKQVKSKKPATKGTRHKVRRAAPTDLRAVTHAGAWARLIATRMVGLYLSVPVLLALRVVEDRVHWTLANLLAIALVKAGLGVYRQLLLQQLAAVDELLK